MAEMETAVEEKTRTGIASVTYPGTSQG